MMKLLTYLRCAFEYIVAGHIPLSLVWRERHGPGKWVTVMELSCRCRKVVEQRVEFPFYSTDAKADSREEAIRLKR